MDGVEETNRRDLFKEIKKKIIVVKNRKVYKYLTYIGISRVTRRKYV